MNNVNKTLYLQFITDIVLLPPEMINKLKDFEKFIFKICFVSKTDI